MKVGRSRIAQALEERLASGTSAAKVAKETAAYLLAEGRVGELDSLMRDIEQLRADKGIIEVQARSAFPLSTGSKADIKTRIKKAYPSAKTIIIDERLDPEVIAGVRLELANEQLDLSIENKLNRFKQLTAAKE